jgi:hypothetical protein
MTQEYVDEFAREHPSITEVWLFGSRANGTARHDSDWDYLAFTDSASTLNAVHRDARFDRPNIDLFIAHGLTALRPWEPHNGTPKVLSLDTVPGGMHWNVSDSEATYLYPKDDPDPRFFRTTMHMARARLVYRRRNEA